MIPQIVLNTIELLQKQLKFVEVKILSNSLERINNENGVYIQIFNEKIFIQYQLCEDVSFSGKIGSNIIFDYVINFIRKDYNTLLNSILRDYKIDKIIKNE